MICVIRSLLLPSKLVPGPYQLNRPNRVDLHVCVIVNRQGHLNIRIGILWAQTGHSTGTCTVSLHVIEL